jgi:hypothetical protein
VEFGSHPSGHAANLILDAKAGGCWCEKSADGGSAMHLIVVYVDPGKLLRLRDALDPYQSYRVEGAMTWQLKAFGDGTDLLFTDALGGYYKDGFEQWSNGADDVLTDQVARLKRFIETGRPTSAHHKTCGDRMTFRASTPRCQCSQSACLCRRQIGISRDVGRLVLEASAMRIAR